MANITLNDNDNGDDDEINDDNDNWNRPCSIQQRRHHQTRSFTRKPRNPVRIYMCFPNLIFNRDKYVLGRVFITANLPAFVVAFVDS